MYVAIIVVFILGYVAIALEHTLKIDKAASALLTGVVCWTLLIIGGDTILDPEAVYQFITSGRIEDLIFDDNTDFESALYVSYFINHKLLHHLSEIASIVFFLLGAMTIVELINEHKGFDLITRKIVTTNKVKLMWLLCIGTFFFSAVLDNLTTSIVMAVLLKELIKDKKDLWFFAGMIVIAANAGGAWSPIGDVTTIMLWVGGRITAANIIPTLIIPSLVCMIVPLIIVSFLLKGEVRRPDNYLRESVEKQSLTIFQQRLIFFLGVFSLLLVPIFKIVTHLPPFMGILFGLGLLWVVTEIMHADKSDEEKRELTVVGVLRKVDIAGVLFFLGILIAVAALQTAGHLGAFAKLLNENIGNIYLINLIIGLLSAIVDNVPLVAGAMGMYDVGPLVTGSSYPTDHVFWEFLTYTAGTGGSCLIIGSAAGVAVMGILKIDFMWYMKKIGLLALIGYLAGAATYYVMFGIS